MLAMSDREIDTQPQPLTCRKLQLLALAARGLSDKEIGRRLGISEETVGDHWRSLFRQLGVHTRGQATYLAGSLSYCQGECLDAAPGQPTTRTCDCA